MCPWKSGKSGYSKNRALTAGTRMVSYGGNRASEDQKAVRQSLGNFASLASWSSMRCRAEHGRNASIPIERQDAGGVTGKKQKTCSRCGSDAGQFEQWENRYTRYSISLPARTEMFSTPTSPRGGFLPPKQSRLEPAHPDCDAT